jgi:hypothetical protein
MSKINVEWHRGQKMPEVPSEEQRAQWHHGHALNCGCRKVTPSILELMETYGYRLPPDVPGLAGIKVPNPAP